MKRTRPYVIRRLYALFKELNVPVHYLNFSTISINYDYYAHRGYVMIWVNDQGRVCVERLDARTRGVVRYTLLCSAP